MIYIDEKSKRLIDNILLKYPYRFFAYGSRTKNTYSAHSDLDLCVVGDISFDEYTHIKFLFESSDLRFKVDLNRWDRLSDEFKSIIRNDLVPYSPNFLTDLNIINLTNILEENIPTWDGSVGLKTHITNDYDNIFRCQRFEFSASTSTHMDSPAHIKQGGKTIEHYNLQNLSGPCTIIYVENDLTKDLKVTVESLKKCYLNFKDYWKDYWIILQTGWGNHWQDSKKYRNVQSNGYMNFPALSLEAAEFLVECKIKGIMIDSFSVDTPDSAWECHKILLNNDILIVENIKYIENMHVKNANVLIDALPIKNATECPININILI